MHKLFFGFLMIFINHVNLTSYQELGVAQNQHNGISVPFIILQLEQSVSLPYSDKVIQDYFTCFSEEQLRECLSHQDIVCAVFDFLDKHPRLPVQTRRRVARVLKKMIPYIHPNLLNAYSHTGQALAHKLMPFHWDLDFMKYCYEIGVDFSARTQEPDHHKGSTIAHNLVGFVYSEQLRYREKYDERHNKSALVFIEWFLEKYPETWHWKSETGPHYNGRFCSMTLKDLAKRASMEPVFHDSVVSVYSHNPYAYTSPTLLGPSSSSTISRSKGVIYHEGGRPRVGGTEERK